MPNVLEKVFEHFRYFRKVLNYNYFNSSGNLFQKKYLDNIKICSLHTRTFKNGFDILRMADTRECSRVSRNKVVKYCYSNTYW